jgi:hypothetical protein
MNLMEKFASRGPGSGLPTWLLVMLDRNFDLVPLKTAPKATSTNGFMLSADDKIDSLQVDATTAALTVYLPRQPVGNRRRTVIKTDASGNAVTVNGNGSLINGAATQVLAAQYNFITVEPTGTGWLIVAS